MLDNSLIYSMRFVRFHAEVTRHEVHQRKIGGMYFRPPSGAWFGLGIPSPALHERTSLFVTLRAGHHIPAPPAPCVVRLACTRLGIAVVPRQSVPYMLRCAVLRHQNTNFRRFKSRYIAS